MRSYPAVFAAAALAAACGSKTSATSTSVTVDATGGTVSLPSGPTLTIPAGALSSGTQITIEQASGAPAGALSSLYKFGPDGTTFAQPVTVAFPVPANSSTASVYWTKPGSSTDYDTLSTTVANGAATARVTHFSQGFAGPACTPNASCASSNACHTAAMVCTSGAPVCTDTGNQPDGTGCGGTNVCTAGTCGAAPVVVSVTVSPRTASTVTGGSVQLTASVTGATNTAVTWAVTETSGGAVSASGLYTAPASGGTFHVVAKSVADTSKTDTATITVTVPTSPPAAPASVAATGACKSITLSWPVASDASSYTVKRSTSAGGTFTAISATPAPGASGWSVTDAASLSDDTQYFYEVFAHNSAGDSASAATANATTALAAPSLNDPWAQTVPVYAYAGDTQASLSWGIGPGIANPTFVLSRASSASGPFTAVTPAGWKGLSFTDTGLSPGTTYTWNLVAEGPNGATCPASVQATTGAAGSAVVVSAAPVTTYVTETTHGTVETPVVSDVRLFGTGGQPYQATNVTGTTWTAARGVLTDDGRVTIPNVPAGNNVIDTPNGSVYTSARSFDYSSYGFGRPDAADPTQATAVTVSVSGLNAWNTANDHLELFSLGPSGDPNFAGAWMNVEQATGVTGVPAASATTASMTFDANTKNTNSNTNNMALISTTAGDVVRLNDWNTLAASPYSYSAPVKSCTAALAPADMADGAAETISCALTAPATSAKNLNIAWSQFVNVAAAAAPSGSATRQDEWFAIYAFPDSGSAYKYGVLSLVAPSLVYLDPGTTSSDFSESVDVPNIYPAASWSQVYIVRLEYNVAYTAPAGSSGCGTVTPANWLTWAVREGPVSELSSQIAPIVGNPGSVTMTKLAPINNADTLIGNGAPVQVSWTAPASGSAPSRYRVDLKKLSLNGCATKIQFVSEVYVPGSQTSLSFPPALFSSGSAYFAQVRAIYAPDETATDFTRPMEFFSSVHFGNAVKTSASFTY